MRCQYTFLLPALAKQNKDKYTLLCRVLAFREEASRLRELIQRCDQYKCTAGPLISMDE